MINLDEIQSMIKDCIARESRLTDWERDFIQNIHEQDRDLSDKQTETLEKIWERIT